MLNWIVKNRTGFWHFKRRTELLEIELFWHLNSVLMLNWIICNKTVLTFNSVYCPVGWGCGIHRLHLCKGVRSPNECPGYDTKQSDGEVPVMLDLWGMWSTPSLLLLPGPLWPRTVAPDKQSDGEVSVMLELWGMQSTPSLPWPSGPLWPGVVALDRVLSMGQIEINCNFTKLNCLKLTVFIFNCV